MNFYDRRAEAPTQVIRERSPQQPFIDARIIENWNKIRSILFSNRSQDNIFVFSQAQERFLRFRVDFEGMELVRGHISDLKMGDSARFYARNMTRNPCLSDATSLQHSVCFKCPSASEHRVTMPNLMLPGSVDGSQEQSIGRGNKACHVTSILDLP